MSELLTPWVVATITVETQLTKLFQLVHLWCAVHLCESWIETCLSTLCLRGFFSVTVRRGFLSLFYLHLFSPLPAFSRAIHIDQKNIIKEEKTVHSALIKKSHMHSTEGFSLMGCIWQDCLFFFTHTPHHYYHVVQQEIKIKDISRSSNSEKNTYNNNSLKSVFQS